MPRYQKTPIQKFETKVRKLLDDNNIRINNRKVKVKNRIIFQYNETLIFYTKKRYYPSKKQEIVEDEFAISIPLTHENLELLSSNIINPPNDARVVIRIFKTITGIDFSNLIIGADENRIEKTELYIKKDLYDIIRKIKKEERADESIRVNNRVIPLLLNNYNITAIEEQITTRDYSLMLEEVLNSGEFTQQQLLPLIEKLDKGDTNEIIIEKQISKQVSWLIDTIQEIIDEPNMTKEKAKDFGKKHFNFNKSDITGEEHLMEMILTKYGKNTFFGVPELLNTDKYVINACGLPRCQFDIILVNYLNDIEVVELKKPSQVVLNYDPKRNKFYPSKDLSIAIAQAERYISTFYKDNDNDYKISGKTIREFVNEQLGGLIEINVCRPSALIIIGTSQTLTEEYEKLPDEKKCSVSKMDYDKNGLQAYAELKNAFKNINILTYSELLVNARLRIGV